MPVGSLHSVLCPSSNAYRRRRCCCYASCRVPRCRYSADDLSGKAACKRALQREMRLPLEVDLPLIGFIGRLDYQKGPDLVLDALPILANLDCQVCGGVVRVARQGNANKAPLNALNPWSAHNMHAALSQQALLYT